MFFGGAGQDGFDTSSQGPYHARAMDDPLRDRRSPRDWAASDQVIEISERIGSFPRLASVVEADLSALDSGKIPADWRDSLVTGKLNFGFPDPQQVTVALDISLAVTVAAICQRCLRAFEMPLSTDVALLLSGPQDTIAARDNYEIWELAEEAVRPIDIVDEVLVMAMPLSAMHEEANDCVDVDERDFGEEMTTPFASLRAQMDKGK